MTEPLALATIAAAPTRPLMRYHGGKWRIAPWIIDNFPPHQVYVEPFGGAASVLLRKPRSYAEIYNDLDEDVVALFAVMRDREAVAELVRQVILTPYARAEFELSYLPTDDRIERARRLLVRSWMAHGSSGLRGHKTGFRLGSTREYSTAAQDWLNFPAAIPAIVERLQGVVIERRPTAQVIAREDRPDTLFYVDPPYMFETRSKKRIGNDLYHGYRHELDDEAHRALLDQLVGLSSMVVLSGYPTALYDIALPGWMRIEKDARADRGEARTEVLWINPQACAALDRDRMQLFARGARA
ncbi:MAG: DNA adenine methylase [Bradyrhizobium sp.]|nr:DNA adenine methylase [Bradyrhizobium sp.]